MHVLNLLRKQGQKVNFLDQLSRAFLSLVASGNLKYFLLWGRADHGKKDKLWCSCSREAWAGLQRLLHLGNKPGKPGGQGVFVQTYGRQSWSAFGKVFLQHKQASILHTQAERKELLRVCVCQQGKSFNSNKRKADGIGSQEDTTQNQPQSHQFPATGSVSQHAEHIVLQHLLPLVSWAVLYCSSLTCFISCRLWSLASLWSTIGKG